MILVDLFLELQWLPSLVYCRILVSGVTFGVSKLIIIESEEERQDTTDN